MPITCGPLQPIWYPTSTPVPQRSPVSPKRWRPWPHRPPNAICACASNTPRAEPYPRPQGTLEFVRDIAHPNLYLLLDIGHLLITGEDPRGLIESAGDRLGYVHLDDNDGEGDLHLSLLDGVMTQDFLDATFAALNGIGYDWAVSLELNPELPDPLDAIHRSRQIILDTCKDLNE